MAKEANEWYFSRPRRIAPVRMQRVGLSIQRRGPRFLKMAKVKITLESLGSTHPMKLVEQGEAVDRMVEYVGRRWDIDDEERAELQVVIDAVAITGTPLEYHGLAPIYVKVEKA